MMPKVRVNDINMYYEEHGQGFPLVMIMGLGASGDQWGPKIIKSLADNFRLIVFDNRGAGKTDKPEIDYSIKMFAADTVGLMDALNIDQANIMGASMGGLIAQTIALTYPERVNKLILVCTTCGGRQSVQATPEAMALLADRNVPDDELKRRRLKLSYPDEWVASHPTEVEEYWELSNKNPMPDDVYARQLKAAMRFNTYDRLGEIQAPTLVMTGSEDILMPAENSKIMAERIPGAKLKVFDGGGHGFFSQFPNEVAKTVNEFLG
ncbi:MAG: alpha/beta fold hydrolase [Bacillota bacterium]